MTYDSILLSAVAIVSTLTGGLAAVRQVGAVVAVAVSAVTTLPRLQRHGFGTS
jgi:hypothetical protein